jgi:glucose-6-phosphate 1-dehydrogenase
MTANPQPETMVRALAEADSIRMDFPAGKLEPTAFIIFGASGDLASRKLVPALYHLFRNERLPESFFVLGASRTAMDDASFRGKLADPLREERWQEFANHLYYRTVDYQSADSYRALARDLAELDQKHGTRGNRIVYLAVPPTLYQPIGTTLGQAGLSRENQEGTGWVRLVVEKPFGRDLATALELEKALGTSFDEHQIFRIDHYLAKETVQNLMVFRFANSIFEPVWNRRYIDHVHITAAESLGVEHRAGYYEQAGVIRDMFQNHMMQLLALTTMEPPSVFEAERVRDEKQKVFGALRPFPVDHLEKNLVLGQYSAGEVGGARVPGYREEPGVDPLSLTPTFAMIKLFVDNWRWQGVPFLLTSGKRLKKKLSEIVIQFKEVPHSMFRPMLGDHISGNRLSLGIQPDENIQLTFQTKSAGSRVNLQSVNMLFDYGSQGDFGRLDAYEKVLLDVMMGDHTLFWRQDGIEQSWAFLTPIVESCETGCTENSLPLHFYQAGSSGPGQIQDLLGSHEHGFTE